MGRGTGYGKIILFGEHFVVHGIPAIAAGISNKAIIEIKKSDTPAYESSTPGTIPELTTAAIRNILNAMKIEDNFSVQLSGDLPTSGGLGSSAAFCVALTRALNKEYGLQLRDKEINAYAYEGEKAFHGNPSGIDNTMATYRGVMRFVRGKTPQENRFEKLKLKKPLDVVVGMTGISSPTKKMVENVRRFKQEDPDQFQNLCNEAGEIVKKAEKALGSGNVSEIGRLMNENHKLLQAIGVSIEKNDLIVKIALDAGALGAKLTGGGGGGCCIALAKDGNHAEEILKKMNGAGFNGLATQIK